MYMPHWVRLSLLYLDTSICSLVTPSTLDFEKVEIISTSTGSRIRSRQLPVDVEIISNFSKSSLRKWTRVSTLSLESIMVFVPKRRGKTGIPILNNFLPMQMMRNLLLTEGDLVSVENVQLPVATYAKIQATERRISRTVKSAGGVRIYTFTKKFESPSEGTCMFSQEEESFLYSVPSRVWTSPSPLSYNFANFEMIFKVLQCCMTKVTGMSTLSMGQTKAVFRLNSFLAD